MQPRGRKKKRRRTRSAHGVNERTNGGLEHTKLCSFVRSFGVACRTVSSSSSSACWHDGRVYYTSSIQNDNTNAYEIFVTDADRPTDRRQSVAGSCVCVCGRCQNESAYVCTDDRRQSYILLFDPLLCPVYVGRQAL